MKDVSDLSSTVKTGLRESSEEVDGQNSKFTSTTPRKNERSKGSNSKRTDLESDTN